MTIKESKSEMEQRIIHLEGAFKKSQFDNQQKTKQVMWHTENLSSSRKLIKSYVM